MTTEFVVFLGPTLDRSRAQEHLPALYLPPAEQGSIFDAAQTLKPSAIVLVDGAFARVPAVRHKEILWAIHRGVAVYGTASIGAIRAAELFELGMYGSGFVYRWYRATLFADDDEVAVAMAPSELGSRALSEALINVRLTLRRAQREGLIDAATRGRIVQLARSVHFRDRTYGYIFGLARGALPRQQAQLIDGLAAWIDKNAIDQKQADTIALLRQIAAGSRSELEVHTRRAPFEMTEAWAADLDAAGLFSDDLLNYRGQPT